MGKGHDTEFRWPGRTVVMDWNRTKTIFIISFLILDLFLIFQLKEKSSINNDVDVITESTLEEQLEAEEITYVDIPKETWKEAYISAKRKIFTDVDLVELRNKFENQTLSIFSEDMIVSRFDTPIPLPEIGQMEMIYQSIKSTVFQGDQYAYWAWYRDSDTILFFQTYKDKPIYFNESGMLVLHLNDTNDAIIGYTQTLLNTIEPVDEQGQQQEVLTAHKAIETLYKKNNLPSKSKITKIELGYFTLVPLSSGVQVFAPTWHIVVDEKQNFFVNAIEGQIQQLGNVK